MFATGLLRLCTKCRITNCQARRVFLRSVQTEHYISRRVFSTCKVQYRLNDTVVQIDNKKPDKRPRISEIKRVLSLAHAERMKIGAAVGFLAISSTVSLSVPFCMGKVIDIINTAAQHGDLTSQLNTICSVLFVVFGTGGFANFCRVYLMDVAGMRIVRQLRENLFSSLMKQDVGFFDQSKTGELINRLSSDATLIGNTVTFNISDGLRALAQAFGACGMMLYVSPKLTLVALCIVPPVAIMARYFGQYMRKLTRDIQDKQADATSIAEEKIGHIRTVRSFAKEDLEVSKYRTALGKVIQIQKKQALVEGTFYGMTGFSGNMIVLTVFYAGGMMMSESMLTIGELTSFLLYAAYIGFSISGLTSFYSELMRGLGASSRIWELIDRKPEVPSTGGLIPDGHLNGTIEFKDVSFTYPSRPDAHILNHLNLTMPAGSVTAVVGASGSGKSTVGGLLLRFYDPNNGNIVIDGEDIKSLDPNWLRNQIGVVSQEPALFSCSVSDNIRYGAVDPSSVSMEEIEEAARQANALMFIKAFPEQFDTMVGEGGKTLSGGQKQRIALARAILKNPRILLLDEATSALDAESEYLVKEALDRLMVGRTVITIAHRLSTIKTADQIAVLDSGRVLELGSYSDLISIENGIFRKLVERQTITT